MSVNFDIYILYMELRAKLKILFEVKVRESEKIIEKILFSILNCVYVFYALKDYFGLISLVFILRPAVMKSYKEQQVF